MNERNVYEEENVLPRTRSIGVQTKERRESREKWTTEELLRVKTTM